MNDFASTDMARVGLWMIRESILKLIREKGPMQPRAVEDALGLGRQLSAEWRGIGYEIMMWMAEQGILVRGDGTRPTYSIPPAH